MKERQEFESIGKDARDIISSTVAQVATGPRNTVKFMSNDYLHRLMRDKCRAVACFHASMC